MLPTIGACFVEWLPVVAPRFSVVKRKFKSLLGIRGNFTRTGVE